MNPVVCDTGPINYLIQIEAIEVLPRLFDRMFIPSAVHLELNSAAAPMLVRAWTEQLPSWCEIRNVDRIVPETFPGLSTADVEVLSLAKETGAVVVIDDLAARKAARVLTISLIGTLGILEISRDRLSVGVTCPLNFALTQKNWFGILSPSISGPL